MVTDLIGEANQTLDALADAHRSIGDLQATDDRLEKQQEERNAAGNAFESGLFDGFGGAPAAAPEPAPTPTPAPAETTETAPAPVPITSSEPEHPVPEAQPEPQTQDTYGAPESTQDAYHSGVMGGPASGAGYAATEQHTMIPMGGMSPNTAAPSSLNPDSFGHSSSGVALSLSADEIDVMKQQVTELDRKAVSAEDSQRQLMAEVDVLRREAEQAEVLAAEKVSAAEGTKKKRFGKSGKKGAAVRIIVRANLIYCLSWHLDRIAKTNTDMLSHVVAPIHLHCRKRPRQLGPRHLRRRKRPKLPRLLSTMRRQRQSRRNARQLNYASRPKRLNYKWHLRRQ